VTESLNALFLFETTTQVMWAEEVAMEEGIPVEVVPAPSGVRNLCGLALSTTVDQSGSLEGILGREGIPFLRHE